VHALADDDLRDAPLLIDDDVEDADASRRSSTLLLWGAASG
jgi:hypothetical protein